MTATGEDLNPKKITPGIDEGWLLLVERGGEYRSEFLLLRINFVLLIGFSNRHYLSALSLADDCQGVDLNLSRTTESACKQTVVGYPVLCPLLSSKLSSQLMTAMDRT